MPKTKEGGWLLDDSITGFGTYTVIMKFADYLIIENDKWLGLRDDAPAEAQEAYKQYVDELGRNKNYDFAMLSMMKKNWTDAELAELGLSKSQIEKYREYEKQQ